MQLFYPQKLQKEKGGERNSRSLALDVISIQSDTCWQHRHKNHPVAEL